MEHKHYVVFCDYSVDDEQGFSLIGVCHTPEEARELFEKQKIKEQKNASDNDYDIIEESDDCWSAYFDGYNSDHIDLYIKEV